MLRFIAALRVAARARRALLAAACLGVLALGSLAGGARSGAGSVLGSSVVTRFDPFSVTFVSLDTGWVLGTEPCANGACLALLETTNTGRSWSTRPLPSALLISADRRIGGVSAAFNTIAGLNVRFADRRNGWIYGQVEVSTSSYKPTLWSTHDGGLIWRKQPLRGLGLLDWIYDLEAAAGSVHLLESNAAPYGLTVKSSPVGQDSWRVSNTTRLGLPAGGSQLSGAIVLHGKHGWVVEGNDRIMSGSAHLNENGRWVSWTPPCASVGDGFTVPAASTAHNLVAVCDMGGFAASPPAGRQFGSWWLYFSNDAGNTFYSGPELGPPRDFFGPLASPVPRVILIGRGVGRRQDLIASFDAGVHWTVVYPGQFSYLGFTSPKQGIGIVQSSGSNKMVMTFDGGHHWSAVTF